MMRKIEELIKRKPPIFLIVSLAYLAGVGFLKWQIHPPIWALAYLGGGLLGVYFLDIAEVFFSLTPSPFRTITFQALFVLVSFFVITSSGSLLATGLVLSMYLTMLLRMSFEWKKPVVLAGIIIFLLETALFIR
jgi:hypothetical protein